MTLDLYQKICVQFLNTPYVWGGKNPLTGEDCSGFVCEILKMRGLIKTNEELDAQEIYDRFKDTGKPVQKPGAILWYGKSLSQINHVALLLDHTTIIEAGHGDSQTLTKEDAAKQGAYIRPRLYNFRNDFLVCLDVGIINE